MNQLADRVFADPAVGTLRQEYVTYTRCEDGRVVRRRHVRIYYGEDGVYRDHSETEVISSYVE